MGGTEIHRLVFRGNILIGFEPDKVKADVSRLLKTITPEQLDIMFSGKTVVLKKNLSDTQAEKFQQAFERFGILVSIDPPVTMLAPKLVTTEPDLLVQESDFSPEILSLESEATAWSGRQPASDIITDYSFTESFSLLPAEAELQPTEPESSFETTEQSLEAAPDYGFEIVKEVDRQVATRENSSNEACELILDDASVSQLSDTFQLPAGSVSKTAPMQTAPMINASGMGSAGVLPDGVAGLSWGGFFWGFVWGLFNRVYISLLGLVPIVNIAVPFYLLFRGRELAWRNKKWKSVEHFQRSQKLWGFTGLLLFAVLIYGAVSLFSQLMNMIQW